MRGLRRPLLGSHFPLRTYRYLITDDRRILKIMGISTSRLKTVGSTLSADLPTTYSQDTTNFLSFLRIVGSIRAVETSEDLLIRQRLHTAHQLSFKILREIAVVPHRSFLFGES